MPPLLPFRTPPFLPQPPKSLPPLLFVPRRPNLPRTNASSVVKPSAALVLVAPPAPPLSLLTPQMSGRHLRVSRFASGSMAEDVPVQNLTADGATCASAVEDLTLLKLAHSNHFLPVVTPFIWQKWHEHLEHAGALEEFADVPKGTRFGWRLGVPDSFPLLSSYIPNNHRSAVDQPDFIMSYIHSEVSARRYTGPFSPDRLERLIGCFRTSPLGVIPKPGSSKFRLIQDHSFPRNHQFIPSVNSAIDSSLFPCDWGTFEDCERLVTEAPPGTQVAVFDVASAHRRSPIAPEDQRFVCVMYIVDGVVQIWIDHAASFGGASSNGMFGRPGDAIVAIYKFNGVEDLLKWVDDDIFFRYPTSPSSFAPWLYSYDESLIFNIAIDLGWPWAPDKFRPFAFLFLYLGFEWDLIEKIVSIPLSKRSKYLARLTSWVAGASVTRADCEGIIGCLQHCCLVLREGRSRLPSFHWLLSSFNSSSSPLLTHKIPHKVLEDVVWWNTQLSSDICSRKLRSIPPPLSLPIFVDASTSFGIGFLADNRWLAWRLLPGWNSEGRDIGWAEMVAIDLGLRALVHSGLRNVHLHFHSDNQGVVGALKAGRSRSLAQNDILRRLSSFALDHDIWLSVDWVKSADNVSDGISRGAFPQSAARFRFPPPLPSYLKKFVCLV